MKKVIATLLIPIKEQRITLSGEWNQENEKTNHKCNDPHNFLTLILKSRYADPKQDLWRERIHSNIVSDDLKKHSTGHSTLILLVNINYSKGLLTHEHKY